MKNKGLCEFCKVKPITKTRFCSHACYAQSLKHLIPIVCVYCQKEFQPRNSGQKLCGPNCAKKAYIPWNKGKKGYSLGKSLEVKRICEECGVVFWRLVHQMNSEIKSLRSEGKNQVVGRFCSDKCRSTGIFTDEVKLKMSKNHHDLPPWNRGKIFVPIEQQKARLKKYGAYSRKTHPERTYFYTLKRRMVKKGVDDGFGVNDWKEVKKLYNFTCPCCFKKEPEIKLTIDHIVPLSKGGRHNKNNIQALCKPCNSSKHTKTIKYLMPCL